MKIKRVEFIEYTGKYPNLCNGVLTVKIDGEIVKFGHNYDSENIEHSEDGAMIFRAEIGCPHEDEFWSSGGYVWFDNDWGAHVETDEWVLLEDELAHKYWDIADELIAVFNMNVPFGCCGGCV